MLFFEFCALPVCGGEFARYEANYGDMSFEIIIDEDEYFLLVSKTTGDVRHSRFLSRGQIGRRHDSVFLMDLNQNLMHVFRTVTEGLKGVKTYTFLQGRELSMTNYTRKQFQEEILPFTKNSLPPQMPEELQPLRDYFDSIALNRVPADTSTILGVWGSTLPPSRDDNFWIEIANDKYEISYFSAVLLSGRYFRLGETLVFETQFGGLICFEIDRFKLLPVRTPEWLNIKFFKE